MEWARSRMPKREEKEYGAGVRYGQTLCNRHGITGVLDALVGANSSAATRESFRRKLRDGELDEKEIEVELTQGGSAMPMFELPNMPGASIGAINIADIFGKSQRTKPKRMTVIEAREPLIGAEADKLLDQDAIVRDAVLGIGGGLATVVGLNVVLGVPQHQAQMISLVLSLVPTTLPSAWVYWNSGTLTSWQVLVAVIVGLAIGTDLGARLANRIDAAALHRLMIAFVSVMAIYMAFRALV